MSLLQIFAVTTQAALVDFLLGEGGEADDLAHIPAALHVLGTGAVTGLATVSTFERRFEVRRLFKVLLVKIFVAGLADVDSNVLSTCFGRGSRITLLLPRGEHRWDSGQ